MGIECPGAGHVKFREIYRFQSPYTSIVRVHLTHRSALEGWAVSSRGLGRRGADRLIPPPPFYHRKFHLLICEGHLSVSPLGGHLSVPRELQP